MTSTTPARIYSLTPRTVPTPAIEQLFFGRYPVTSGGDVAPRPSPYITRTGGRMTRSITVSSKQVGGRADVAVALALPGGPFIAEHGGQAASRREWQAGMCRTDRKTRLSWPFSRCIDETGADVRRDVGVATTCEMHVRRCLNQHTRRRLFGICTCHWARLELTCDLLESCVFGRGVNVIYL